MRKLAIIGASYLQRPLVEKAHEMGLYTLCFAWRNGAVCAEISDKFYDISIVEKDKILDVCQREKIDGVCSIASDVAAPTVAYVAEKMGLVGNPFDSAVMANNKYLMRNAFAKANVPCPHYRIVTSNEQPSQDNMRFPLIVKPVDRSGSLGVTQVNNQDELISAVEIALTSSFKGEAIIEDYIEGREISVEFISYQGKHYPLQITDKVTTEAPHFVELEHHQPAILADEMYQHIYGITKTALNSLGLINGASHSEYRITEDGHIFVMEIGGRMGGDFIGSDLVPLSTGYDYVKGVIDVALGCFKAPTVTQKSCSGIFFLCQETEYLTTIINNWRDYPFLVKGSLVSNELKHVTSSAERSGYIIYNNCEKLELKSWNLVD